MKKTLSMLLALLTVVSIFAVGCDSEDDKKQTTTTEKTTTTTRRQAITPEDNDNPDEEIKVPELTSGEQFTLDGDLTDWADYKTIGIIGEAAENCENSENKKVTFYGALTEKGLFLACDSYHDVYEGASAGNWYENCNFEFFVGSGNIQYYAYARGIDQPCSVVDGKGLEAFMKSEKIDQGTVYHTIVEVFLPMSEISEADIYYNTLDVGVAWKTQGEDIVGGAGTVRDGADDWWVPKGTWPNNDSKAVVAPSGIYTQEEYTY